MLKRRIRHFRSLCWPAGVVCALILIAPRAEAQQSQRTSGQDQQNQAAEPIPAYHSPLAATANDQTDDSGQTLVPDKRPLSGAQYISAGNLKTTRSYWQPRFDLTGSADSNPQERTSNMEWGGWGSFLAGIDIHHTSGTSETLLAYTGGGMYSNAKSVPTGTVQELGFTEKVSFRRSVLSLFDQLSYLPQAGLGFGGLGGLPLTGGGPTGLGPGFTAGQSIVTGQAQNLANSSVVQLETFLTPRSSITMTGAYSLLHFFSAGLVDSGVVIFQGGYNYQLTPHNTMALLYNFNHFRYPGLNESFDTHSAQASFARRVTGRFSFQIAAGPEFAIFQVGAGSSGGTGGGSGAASGSSTRIYWSLNSAVSYLYPRTALGLAYSHDIRAGSGLQIGSMTDIVTGSVTRRITRTFSSGLSAGYARNSTLSVPGSQSSGPAYDYWFAGASLAKPLSETLALTFSYQMQYQTSNMTFCIGPSCGTSLVRHLISLGLSWHQRPLLF